MVLLAHHIVSCPYSLDQKGLSSRERINQLIKKKCIFDTPMIFCSSLLEVDFGVSWHLYKANAKAGRGLGLHFYSNDDYIDLSSLRADVCSGPRPQHPPKMEHPLFFQPVAYSSSACGSIMSSNCQFGATKYPLSG